MAVSEGSEYIITFSLCAIYYIQKACYIYKTSKRILRVELQ